MPALCCESSVTNKTRTTFENAILRNPRISHYTQFMAWHKLINNALGRSGDSRGNDGIGEEEVRHRVRLSRTTAPSQTESSAERLCLCQLPSLCHSTAATAAAVGRIHQHCQSTTDCEWWNCQIWIYYEILFCFSHLAAFWQALPETCNNLLQRINSILM